ncbi:hypothetical protein [Gloeocapsopsis sp. IPPAS B-1203]|uniref:hypothetical protein n=1 Tax=Gloeocapsopsis sp. IPPAS B-1203 TaxID=2049454 RepID=UPI000C1A82F2|nr:hypothetical protein [Gloeocapsopsis sp. IPPAS B-1203]PIG90537.1 hypothetical protein CSQ79_25800 [Gloeocapsopsis sp. IPPAS B-1203]
MSLDKQIQLLINDAPQDGITPKVVAAIAPGLKLLAERLGHLQYYILQSLEQEWVVTTLRSRDELHHEKRVVYAFPTLKDVVASELEPQLIAIPIPVTLILFQLIALETVDSIIFFETPGDTTNGIEIRREDMQRLIQLQLQQSSLSNTPSNYIPPDIA